MAYDNFLSVVKGSLEGTSLAEMKRLEDSVGAGRNAYLMGVTQFAQGYQAISLVESALKFSGKAPFPISAGRFLYLSPILLAIASKRNIENKWIRSAVIFIQDHYGTLCHVAALVSSVVLIYFGNLFFGVPTLIILGIGYLDRKGLLPGRVRHFIHEYSSPFMTIASVFVGNPVNRFFAVLSCISYLINYHLASKQAKEVSIIQQPPISFDINTVKAILNNQRIPLEINRDHIHYPCMPISPAIDISELSTRFERINWENNIGALRRKLQGNQRFVQREGNVNPAMSDEFLIKYVTDNMKDLIDGVKNRRLLQGEPLDYGRLQDYLKLIAQNLRTETNEVEIVDQLLRLAVEGGKHCGPGAFEVAEELALLAIDQSSEIPFQTKVLNSLQTNRVHHFQKIYQEAFKTTGILGRIVDWQDVHVYNQFINLYGNQLGLRSAGADNDAIAVIDPFIALATSPLAKKITQLFWNEHDIHSIISNLQREKAGSLPKHEFFTWWRDWLQKAPIPHEEKGKLIDDLADAQKFSLFGVTTADLGNDGRIVLRENAILAMLYCMGIVKRVVSQPIRQAARPLVSVKA